MSHISGVNLPAEREPKIVGPDYVQSVDNLTAEDFMKIYLETLRFQDPFRQQDLSKSVEDIVRLNQIRFFTDMKFFVETFTSWMNQITFMQSISLIGKSFVFATDAVEPNSGLEYYLVSTEEIDSVKVQILEGEEVVKEISTDLKKGLNSLDLSDLPPGKYTVKVVSGDVEVTDVMLGFKDRVSSVGILGGELLLDLESGKQVSAGQIIYVGV